MATTSSSLTASCGENAQARPKARRAASALPPAPRKSPACRPEGQLASPSTERSLRNRASTTQSDEPFHIANLRSWFSISPQKRSEQHCEWMLFHEKSKQKVFRNNKKNKYSESHSRAQ